ncbi:MULTISPECIES: DoxX family protein [Nocardia]|uniref:DoxX family protein n=1 Tax=Nocardia TaxID=1817 RepID=UPI0007E9CEC9|nr:MULTISPECIES: DoxX family protein [Nocardia]OBF83257.1 DoxX family protein [Mycobacterium sp. 852002-51759_SCH5129042]MBF6276989.1 DoxX family protein [Nocardia nova]MBV7704968.1 DoxX family protein [Nocardia nova]OBA54119.1 DoxX family protein [Nocardia sp. 852002-51101_SCH5132738]OBB38728.1 DoxX family protein [Nocardia sp. 852002-51244_SCH5132740]
MTAVTASAPSVATRPGKIRTRVLWTLQIVLGLFFVIASGLPKVVGQSDAVRIFHDIGWGDWFRYFTGLVEISGGIGLLVPRLSWLAAAGLSITMVCAAATQAFVMDAPAGAIFPLVLMAVFAWIAYERRPAH